MKKHFLVLLFLFINLLSSFTVAQEYQVGVKLGSNVYQINRTYSNKTLYGMLPTEIGINIGIRPFDNWTFEGRISYDFQNGIYKGEEYGIISKYYLLRNVYAAGGILFHGFIKQEIENLNIDRGTYPLLNLGMGFNPTQCFNIESLFLLGGNVTLGSETKMDDIFSFKRPFGLTWAIKIGVGYYLNL